MKFSIIRTDKNNQQHLSQKTLDALLQRMKTDTKRGDVERLRAHLPYLRSGYRYSHMADLPRVYPCAELAKDANGNLVMARCNGLVLLTVAPLPTAVLRKEAKRAASLLPTTLAAFEGSSGRSIKILVKVAPEEGALPTDEQLVDDFCRQAYTLAVPVYEAVLPAKVVVQQASARMSFRMTLDASPYVNTQSVPFRVSTPPHQPQVATPADDAFEWDNYAQNEHVYSIAYDKAIDEVGDLPQEQRAEAIMTAVAHHLCQSGMPQEEAVLHISQHARYQEGYSEDRLRAIVDTTYATTQADGRRTSGALEVGRQTRMLIGFLQSRYLFRYNEVMGYVEYKPNNTWVNDWQPVDERAINGMTTNARLAGLNAWDRDVARYIRSDKVPTYNPIDDYLWQAQGKWDGRDHIGMLARTVPTDNPHWEQWFRTWLLGMVAQWLGRNRQYGNSVAPLLISRQGYNKSTFCRSLLPDELQWGYTDNLSLDEKRPVLQAMSQMLLINLDEFNQISERTQAGFLKNVIQLARVKAKRPYGKHVEDFPRLASFIATTNMPDVLADASGSRRFIGVELTGPIDVSHRPNHQQLYAQAQALINNGERYWFDEADVHELMQHNRRYQTRSLIEDYFHQYFDLAQPGDPNAEWLTATAIYTYLRSKVGAQLRPTGLTTFGRKLASMDGIQQKRSAQGSCYLVVKKS